ncbi:MAG: hypothetical protein IT379_00055 [Deltaproteobacteria bacterium]|nr:hypothetical protein [Deltaproteobacteria bacterium]
MRSLSARRLSLLLALAVITLVAACGDDDGGDPTDDAGTGAPDTPAPPPPGDGGDLDAGTPPDASTPPPPPMDMSTPRPDAGPLEIDAGPCEADPGITFGEPMTATPGEWTFVEFPDSVCMNGTPTGLGINLAPGGSDRVVVLFEGGNACFDDISCLAVAHIDGFDAGDLPSTINLFRRGLLNRADPDNPVRDWNMVFVPYCSGDVHGGSTDSGAMGLVQQGYRNTTEFLKRIVPTFRDSSLVLWAGQSAGGFGAAWNYDQAQRAFGCTPVYLLDDSGPPMSDEYLRPCIQRQWRDVWNLDASLPADCPGCFDGDGGLVNLVRYIGAKYPNRRLALLSTTEDRTIRAFYGYGYTRMCNFPSLMPAEDYRAGLFDLRDNVVGDHYPLFRMFMVEDDGHTFVSSPLGGTTAGGVTLAEWIRLMVTDDPSWDNAGP